MKVSSALFGRPAMQSCRDAPLSIYDVRLHVLSRGDEFVLRERRPGALTRREAIAVESKLVEAAGPEERESQEPPLTV